MAPIGRCRTCVICRKRYSRQNDNKRKFMAKFPMDEDRCRQWVKNIGNEDLAYIPIEKLHEMKYVCGDHFQSKDFNKKKSRLKKWAVPSLLIKMPPLSDHSLAEFPCHMAKSERSEIAPSSSAVVHGVDTIRHDHSYLEYQDKTSSTKKSTRQDDELQDKSQHCLGQNVQNVNESNVLAKEHSYTSALSVKTKYPTTQSSGASTSVAPQPSTSKGPERVEVLGNEIDLPVHTEDLEMPEGCDLEIEYCIDDFPPPEPQYSWQRSDTIVLADDETDPKARVNDPNDVGDLSMYNDDVHQLTVTSNQQKGENAADTRIEEDNQTHFNYTCNLCKKSISGFRYRCVQCANFDLCALCEAGAAHAQHYVLRIPKPKAYGEVEAVLACIRKNLFEGKTDDAVASGDLLDEIKTEAEDDVVQNEAVQDEITPLSAIVDQIDEDEDVGDPLVWETETRPSTAQLDYSSDSDISAVRTEPPVLRKRKRKNSDDPLRIDSAASNHDEEDEVTTSRVKTPHSIPEDIFNLHLQLEETPDETPAKKPARSTPASKTYVVITKEQHQRMLKLNQVKVNINRLTREDINAALHKTWKS